MRASGLEIGEVVAGARAIEPVIRIQVVQLAFGRAATMALCAGGRQVIGLQRTAAGAARVVTPFERCLYVIRPCPTARRGIEHEPEHGVFARLHLARHQDHLIARRAPDAAGTTRLEGIGGNLRAGLEYVEQ